MNDAHPRTADHGIEAAMRIAAHELGTQPARLYLFGSRACGDAARASDIDIAILPDAPLEPGTLAPTSRARWSPEELNHWIIASLTQ